MNPSQNPSALRSKKIITETLLKLMKQYSYNEITIKHIILEAKVSRKTFYRNFSSKDDVLNSYIDTVLYDDYIKTIIDKRKYSIFSLLNIIFLFCEKNRDLLFMLRDNGLLYFLLLKLNRMIPVEHQKIAQDIHDTSEDFKVKKLSQYIISFNIGAMWNIISEWVENDMEDDATEIKMAIAYYLSNIKSIDLRDL